MVRASLWWLCLVAALTLAACGAAPPTQQALTTSDSAEPVVIAGSSTVYPLTYRLAYAAQASGMDLRFDIRNIGTGGGFRAFCADRTVDIVNASRPITPNEQGTCLNAGRTLVPFQIGYDALTVAMSKQNTFVTDLSIEQLERIFSGSVTSWRDVNPHYPDEPIALYSPGKDSGTFDYFTQVVLAGDPTRLPRSAKTSEDDTVLVKGLEANPNAIGYFGYAYYQFNDDNLRAIPIRRSAQDTPVAPPNGSVAGSQYPFIRPLFLYSDPQTLKEKPHVARFIDFYLEHVNSVIRDVGYFPEQQEALLQARKILAGLRG